jgi:hypothetical protein
MGSPPVSASVAPQWVRWWIEAAVQQKKSLFFDLDQDYY